MVPERWRDGGVDTMSWGAFAIRVSASHHLGLARCLEFGFIQNNTVLSLRGFRSLHQGSGVRTSNSPTAFHILSSGTTVETGLDDKQRVSNMFAPTSMLGLPQEMNNSITYT